MNKKKVEEDKKIKSLLKIKVVLQIMVMKKKIGGGLNKINKFGC